jgi:hypothetical protein
MTGLTITRRLARMMGGPFAKEALLDHECSSAISSGVVSPALGHRML